MIVWKINYEDSNGSIEKFAKDIEASYRVLAPDLRPHHIEVDTVYLGRAVYERLRDTLPVVAINPVRIDPKIPRDPLAIPRDWLDWIGVDKARGGRDRSVVVGGRARTALSRWAVGCVERKRKKSTASLDLYRHFRAWCSGQSIEPERSRVFVEALKASFPYYYEAPDLTGERRLMFRVRIKGGLTKQDDQD